MLKRVVIAPRHYFEHSVANLAWKFSFRNPPSMWRRWHTVAAMNPQYNTVRCAPWYEEGDHAENDFKNGGTVSAFPSTPATSSPPNSSEHLASVFVTFIENHGRTVESALSCLNSGSPAFLHVRQIFQQQDSFCHVVQHLAGSNNPALCTRLLTLAIAYGRSPKMAAYECACWALSKSKQYRILLEVCCLAKANLGKPTRRLLDWRLRAALELENFTIIENALRDYEDAGMKPLRRTWHIILIAHLRNRNITAARRCLTLMEQAGFPPDPTTHAAIAANYHHLGIDPQVTDLTMSVLGSLPPSKAVSVVNQLLESYLRFDDRSKFCQLLSLFDDGAIAPIRILLEPLVDLEGSQTPSMAPKISLSLIPDAKTFLIAIRLCIKHSRFLAAEKLFALMEQNGIPLSSAILTSYLNLEFSIGRPDFAVFVASHILMAHNLGDLFSQLIRRQPKPHWKWPYQTSRTPPHIDIFNALLKGVLNDRGLDAARTVLQLMDRANVGPNSKTLRILVVHLMHHERASASTALRALRQLSPTFSPSPDHLHPIINRVLRDEKDRLYLPGRARASIHRGDARLYSSSEADNNSEGPTAGLQIGRPVSRPNLMRSLVDSMVSRGVRSNSRMLALKIRYDAIIKRDTATATDTYTDLLSRGITPSIHHITALMEGFTGQGETDTALKVMRFAERHVKPNLVMYTILLSGYARQHQPKTAVRLFQTMIASGIQPDVQSICVLCYAFLDSQRLHLARKLLVTLWSYIQPFPYHYNKLSLVELLRIFRNLDTSIRAPRQGLDLESRIRLRRRLTRVIVEYKRASGLRDRPTPSSSEARRLAKESLSADWRM